MTIPSFASVKSSYEKLWNELVPTQSHVPELTKICNGLLAHKSTYQSVAQTVWGTSDYWYVVALIDQMEGGGGARTYLGNGQSLSHVTTEVPAGRGPFANFHDGAVDALHIDGLQKVTDWSPPSLGYHLELFNGPGYFSKPIADPYLASWSNKYTKGKYIADHVYDANAVSQQPGALTILKVLMTIDPTILNQKGDDVTTSADTNAIVNAVMAALQPQLQTLVTQAIANIKLPIPAPVAVPVTPTPIVPTTASTIAHIQPVLDMFNGVLAKALPPPYNLIPQGLGGVAHLVSAISGTTQSDPSSVGKSFEDIFKASLAGLHASGINLPPWLQTLVTDIEPVIANAFTNPPAKKAS